MSAAKKTFSRRRFAALLACGLGCVIMRPVRSLASVGGQPSLEKGRMAAMVVDRRVEIHCSADLGDVVMQRGSLSLKGGGCLNIQRLDCR